MQEMQTIAINDLCQSVMWLCCAKMDELIKFLFGVKTLGAPRNTVLDRGPNPPQEGGGEVGGNFALHMHASDITVYLNSPTFIIILFLLLVK